MERMSHRFGGIALQVAAVSGLGIAATSLAALLVSEQTKLFGFMESNYRPAIIVAISRGKACWSHPCRKLGGKDAFSASVNSASLPPK